MVVVALLAYLETLCGWLKDVLSVTLTVMRSHLSALSCARAKSDEVPAHVIGNDTLAVFEDMPN